MNQVAPVGRRTPSIDLVNRPASRPRLIGPAGTVARLAVAFVLLGSVLHGHVAGAFRPAPWILGLIGFFILLLGWQAWRSRRTAARIQATGPIAHVGNLVVFFALYLTPDYAPPLFVTSDAALVFYGASMLISALRGYAGCEVLAVSNWVLGRDDQVGCLLFAPIDRVESKEPPPHRRQP